MHIIAGYAESVHIPGKMYNSCIFIDDNGDRIGNMRKVNAWGTEKLKFCGGRFLSGNQYKIRQDRHVNLL